MSETGHARNVQHMAEMISFCTGYGGAYNPSNGDLTVPKLQDIHDTCAAAIDGVTSAMGPWKSAVTARQESFKGIRKLTTKVMNSFAASGAPDNAINQAETFKRKIDGDRAKTLVDDPDTPEDESKGNSVSQQSYTQLVEHLDNLIGVLTADGHYNPNEDELKLTTLNDYSNTLREKNQAVITANTPFSNARITRDNDLYDSEHSLVTRAALVKKYVKSVFGADSPQFAQVSGLEFRDPR